MGSSEKVIEEKSNNFSLLDLFKYKSLRWIAIICASVDFVIEFIYDGTILSLGKIGISVYLDQILVGLVEIGAALYAAYIIVKVSRKRFCTINFALISVCTALIGLFTLITSH